MGLDGVFRKGNTLFVPAEKITKTAEELFGALEEEKFFADLEHESFIRHTAKFLNGLNLLHPFREGNGRVQRLFVEILAARAGYHLDLSTHTPQADTQAAILGTKGQMTGWEVLIRRGMRE